MNTPDHTAIARQIYRDLKGKPHGMVDWQACDRYCLSCADLRQVIAASAGNLRLRPPGILEVVQAETAK